MSDESGKIRPEDTYVFGDGELEELGDASLTSILREIKDCPPAQDGQEGTGVDYEEDQPLGRDYRDPEIDELLQSNSTSSGAADPTHEVARSFEDSEVLIPHEALVSSGGSGNGR